MKFTCPKCKTNRLEEVMVDVTVASQVTLIYDDGDMDYGNQTNEGGEIDHYQCIECGCVLKDDNNEPVKDQLDLVKWLEKHA